MAVTLHQLRCFLAALQHESFTRAAEQLEISQPSLSEQVRLLERSLGTTLFQRLGRGVASTEAARALRPHALASVESADEGARAVAAVSSGTAGTVRFGLFGAAHLYIAGDLVSAIAAEHPNLRIALVGQNSSDVIHDIRTGRLDAGLVALPIENDDELRIRPVARDEVVYVSVDPDRARGEITPSRLATANLVLSEATWGERDFTRQRLTRAVQSAQHTLVPRIEVENVETALEIASRGVADTIAARGVVARVAGNLHRPLCVAPLQPRLYDEFAVVHRRHTSLSRAVRTVISHAADLMREVTAL